MRLGRWLVVVVVVVVTVRSGTSRLVEIGDGNIKGIKGIINTMGLEIKSYVCNWGGRYLSLSSSSSSKPCQSKPWST